MSTVIPPAELARKRLGPTFAGTLIGPDDAGYDDARAVYNGLIDRRPAFLVTCSGPKDVAGAIAFAREHDLMVAVRGGGHNGAGFGVCDDGVVIDLSSLREVVVDSSRPHGHGGRWLHVGRG